jgi:enolase
MSELSLRIESVQAIEVLDSRGIPTVEVHLGVKDPETKAEFWTLAIAPSGASTGLAEALEIRDNDPKQFLGRGVKKVLTGINTILAPHAKGRVFPSIHLFDEWLNQLDGTENKSKFGANAILPMSMAFCRALAAAQKKPLWQYLNEIFFLNKTSKNDLWLPTPMMNIFNGGVHADNAIDIQEFMIVPHGFATFSESLHAGVVIFHTLKAILKKRGLATGVGDEGGFAPILPASMKSEGVLGLLLEAVEKAGFRPGDQVSLALDCAASEFCEQPGKYRFEKRLISSDSMITTLAKWCRSFPILSIEDGLAENDWDGWVNLTSRLGDTCQLVADDLFVTNSVFLKKGAQLKAGNAILIKLNQIGTVSETLKTMHLAKELGYNFIVSHRSGETEDVFIADLAFATGGGLIKTGACCRSERTAKYNQLLRFEQLKENASQKVSFAGKKVFERFFAVG